MKTKMRPLELTEYTKQVLRWGAKITVKISCHFGFDSNQRKELAAAGARFDISRGWVIDMDNLEDAERKCKLLAGYSMECFYNNK